MKRLLLLAFLVLLAPPVRAQSTASVTVAPKDAFAYAPDDVTVSRGATVTWTWDGSGHSVTFAADDSGVLGTGATYQRAFPNAGTFAYHCSQHPGSMTGTVRVVAASASPKPTTASPKPTTAKPTVTRTPTTTPTRTPSRTPTLTPTTAAPTTASPTPTTISPTPSPSESLSLEAPLPPDRTNLAIVLGLLVGLGGIGTATLLFLRGRRA